jgi:hypothetical protein
MGKGFFFSFFPDLGFSRVNATGLDHRARRLDFVPAQSDEEEE